MSQALSVGGLASGLDTNSIIDGLVNLEMARVRREEQKLKQLEARDTAFNELVTRVGTFASKAGQLESAKAFNLYTANSSDEDLITLSGGVNSIPGSYEIEGFQLASSHKIASGSFGTMTDGLGFTGSFEISRSQEAVKNDPSKTFSSITVSESDSLKDIANKINGAEGIGVSASILQMSSGDFRLILTGKDQGSDHFAMRETEGTLLSAGSLGFMDDTQIARSSFALMKQSGGAATTDTLFNQLSTGIGANNLQTGDSIRITGTDANAVEISPIDFEINTDTSTIQDFLTAVENAFGGSGNVTVEMNNSGEVIITDKSGGVSEISFNMEFISAGSNSSLQLGESKTKASYSNVLTEGRRAFLTVDGVAVNMQSNKDDKVLAGTTLNLHKLELGTKIQVGLSRDTDGIKNLINGFIDEYNSLLQFIDEKTKVEVKEDDNSNPLSSSAKIAKKGALYNDGITRRIKTELQRMITATVPELEGVTQYTSLARLGITSDKTTGKLVADSEKLDEALKTDFEGVRRLFVVDGFSSNGSWEMGRYSKDTASGIYSINTDTDEFDTDKSTGVNFMQGNRTGDVLTSANGDSKGLSIRAPLGSGTGTFTFVRGIAGQIKQYHEQASDFVNGMFTENKKISATKKKNLEDRIITFEDRVEGFRNKLVRQFADLEQAMSRLQSQSAAFMNQIGSLQRR